MKKLMFGLVLLAMVACSVQQADAGRKVVVGPPLKWMKTNSSILGAYVTDSTKVSIPWSAGESAAASTGSDTTMVFDARNLVFAGHDVAGDSTALGMKLGFRVDSYATSGAVAASTDSSLAYTQFSYDGYNWTINAGSGVITNAWFKLGHGGPVTGLPLVPALYGLNRLAGASALPPFWRVIVTNIGAAATALVRSYEVRAVYWVED